tara:strand:- start:3679 stop:5430 length:1752 start_codon:yes stop_codon:yes gene_type:complete
MSPIRRVFTYIRRYRSAFSLGLGCVVITTTLQLSGPWVLKFAIDDLAGGVTFAKLRYYALLLLVLAAVSGTFRFLMRRIIIGASREIEYDLRNDFFAHLQRLSLGYFHKNRTGDLMSRATNDLSAVRMMVGPAVMYTANTALTFLVAIILMLSINVRLTLIALIPLPFVSVAARYFGRAIHHRFERIQAQLSDLSAVTQETLSGVRVVRAYRQESFELSRFRSSNEEYVHRNRALIKLQSAFYPSLGMMMGIGALLVLWQGSVAVVGGEMTVGALVAFNAYLLMLTWPMIAFGWVTNLLQRGLASWIRILQVLDSAPTIADTETASAIPGIASVRGDVEFRNLTFAYGEHVVLHNISAIFPAGQTTAIVGATGSGKSTLLSLIARLYDPPLGTVFVDDVDVHRIPLSILRGAVGFVPQEPFLFSDTLAENITFGVKESQLSEGSLEQSAQVSRLDKDLQEFPEGYQTLVGERGITLSGGQKQRTAIARALVINPKILVLDDALSAVDTHTEEEILIQLRAVMKQRTAIIVSHRISTVRHADQILVLDQGRIVERGCHDELVARQGVYAALHRRQLLEEELAAS